MKYLALFTGIHAPGIAWDPLGWECVGFSEIEPFPCSVLKARYPEVPNLGDITKLTDEDLEKLRADGVDLVVGGSPCQSFSVAGLRKGLADPRGNLLLHFLRVVDRVRPRWVVWENVPGVLSSVSHESPDAVPPDGGVEAPPGSVDEEAEDGSLGEAVVVEDEYQADEVSAFACFVAGLQELGYGVSWGSPDAQFFGLAQRRERVFVVAHLGDGAGPFAVLLDRESLSGNPPPRREAGQGVARSLDTGSGGSGAKEQQRTFVGGEGQPLSPLDVSRPLCAPRNGGGGSYRADAEVETLVPVAGTLGEIGGKARPGDTPDGAAAGYLVPEVADTLTGGGSTPAAHGKKSGTDRMTMVPAPLVFRKSRRAQSEEDDETWVEDDVANTLNLFDGGDVRATEAIVQPIVFDDHAVPGQPVAPTLQAGGSGGRNDMNLPCVAFAQNQREEVRDLGDLAGAVKTPGTHEQTFVAQTLRAESKQGSESPLIVEPGYINPRQTRNSQSSNQVGIKPDAQVADALSTDGPGAVLAYGITNQPEPGVGHDVMPTLSSKEKGGGRMEAVVYENHGQDSRGKEVSVAPQLNAKAGTGGNNLPLVQTMAVRRLTPTECERLQGFPDGWTAVQTRKVKHRKKCPLYPKPEDLEEDGLPRKNLLILGPDEKAPCKCKVKAVPAEHCPDGPRYKALGNSMATTVVRWIGERIDIVDRFLRDVDRPEVRCNLCGQATTWVPPGTPCSSPRLDGSPCAGTLEATP